MSSKIKKLDQDTTEKMFASEYKKKESLWNVMMEIYKNRNAKKTSFKILSE